VQLAGYTEQLHWFRDGVLDFVYSSHLLEDLVDTEAVLREWIRILRPGGRLILADQVQRTLSKFIGWHVHLHVRGESRINAK